MPRTSRAAFVGAATDSRVGGSPAGNSAPIAVHSTAAPRDPSASRSTSASAPGSRSPPPRSKPHTVFAPPPRSFQSSHARRGHPIGPPPGPASVPPAIAPPAPPPFRARRSVASDSATKPHRVPSVSSPRACLESAIGVPTLVGCLSKRPPIPPKGGTPNGCKRLSKHTLSRIYAVESTPHPALSRKGRGNFAPQAASVAFTER